MTELKIQRIDVADKIDRRFRNFNQRRVLLKVDAIPVGGASVGNFTAPQGESIVEVWEDQLPGVLAQLRTDAHALVLRQAEEAAKAQTEVWLQEQGIRTAEAREEALKTRCPITPQRVLASLGIKGMPPLRSIRFVTSDLSASIPLEEWNNMSDEERSETFWVQPPVTEANAVGMNAASTKYLADVIAQALSRNGGGDSNGKGRGRG